MSDRETTQPTPRMRITEATGPAPPWSGVKFTCEKCKGVFELEAADKCRPKVDELRGKIFWGRFETPPCPTPGCSHINAVRK